MADYTLTTDPFFHLSRDTASLREKVSDSIFENYKLQVAQTNDINNRAMQVALHNTSSFADLKGALSKGTLETMIAAERTGAAIGATSAAIQRSIADSALDQQRLTMEQSEITRDLINGLNTQNLNTALINTNIGFSGLNTLYGGMGLAYSGAVSATQVATTNSAVNALDSAISNQRLINTGNIANTTQTSTPTSIN
ncbi:MAG: hypothetical protein ACOVLB_07880 [Candidatus Nanopelagicus sp.]